MSFFDLQNDFDENSLDLILSSEKLEEALEIDIDPISLQVEDKKECSTYEWIWDDEEPQNSKDSEEQTDSIEQIKAARMQQEEKVKRFISGLKPITISPKKTEIDATTEAGSPKKKKIRKMTLVK